MKILHIDSSIMGANSVSRDISAGVVAKLKALYPDSTITYRDLTAPQLPYFSADLMALRMKVAKGGSAAEAPVALQEGLALVNTALDEFLAADLVVVGAPMYNLSVPSQLKSWIDAISVAGRTFRYTAAGAQGLCGGKKVILASSRGGIYSSPQGKTFDFQETYLAANFGFFGIGDVKIIRAEGVNVSPEQRRKAIEAAKAEIAELKNA
jgi:FMN-dependent NADH-azoreductase